MFEFDQLSAWGLGLIMGMIIKSMLYRGSLKRRARQLKAAALKAIEHKEIDLASQFRATARELERLAE